MPVPRYLHGVYNGFSNFSLSISFLPFCPANFIPCTVPFSVYSFQALPVIYPRTIASTIHT